MSNTGKISVGEAKNITVRRWISDFKKFAAYIDYKHTKPELYVEIGLRKQVSILGMTFGSYTCWASRLYLETPRNWVLEVFGSDNLEDLKLFAQDLARQFSVHVHVKLQVE